MNKFLKFALLTVALLWCGAAKAQLPAFSSRNLDKQIVELNDLAGEKLTVLDFWATWCKPCVTFLPKINSLHYEFEDKGVAFIGVNTDGPRSQSKVKPFCVSLGLEYPVLLDPDQELVNRFNITVFPTLIILNSAGKELFIHEGYSPGDEQVVRQKIKNLLKNE